MGQFEERVIVLSVATLCVLYVFSIIVWALCRWLKRKFFNVPDNPDTSKESTNETKAKIQVSVNIEKETEESINLNLDAGKQIVVVNRSDKAIYVNLNINCPSSNTKSSSPSDLEFSIQQRGKKEEDDE